MESILTEIKKLLGIDEKDTSIDGEIIIHINSVISTLTQLGVGPDTGFGIVNSENTWQELIGERKDINYIRSYIYLKVRLLFDPPQNSFLLTSIKDQCQEFEWRIEVQN